MAAAAPPYPPAAAPDPVSAMLTQARRAPAAHGSRPGMPGHPRRAVLTSPDRNVPGYPPLTPGAVAAWRVLVDEVRMQACGRGDGPGHVDLAMPGRPGEAARAWVQQVLRDAPRDAHYQRATARQCDSVLLLLAASANAWSLERMISGHFASPPSAGETGPPRGPGALIRKIRDTHGLDARTAQGSVSAYGAMYHGDPYSVRRLGGVMLRVARDHELSKEPVTVLATILAVAFSRVLGVASTAALSAFAGAPGFDLGKFGLMSGTGAAAEFFETVPNALLNRVFAHTTVNDQVADLLFYTPLEDMAEGAIRDLLNVVDRGKQASRQLMTEFAGTIIGGAMGVVASLALLTTINPGMGLAGLASLPFMYLFARGSARRGASLRAAEGAEHDRVASRIGGFSQAVELLRSSPMVEPLARELARLMGREDGHASARGRAAAWGRFLSVAPHHVGGAVAGLLGAFVWHLPLGSILASALIAGWLHFPIKAGLVMFSQTAPALVYDAVRMWRILPAPGQGDRERERDKRRIDASRLRHAGVEVTVVSDRRIKAPMTKFSLGPGEIIAISGESASGRTTVLRAIAGLTRFDSGEVRIGGVPVEYIARFEHDGKQRTLLSDFVAYVPQDSPVISGMSLLDNLLINSRMPPTEATRDLARQGLLALGLPKFVFPGPDGRDPLDLPVQRPSGGEKQRIAALRPLFRRGAPSLGDGAPVLLFDEPTAWLHENAVHRMIKFLLDAKAAGRTVIVATHNPLVVAAADRVVRLDGANGIGGRARLRRVHLVA